MKKALWNGNVIWAYEISQDHLVEEQIRRASSNNELLCTDPECNSPTLQYRHGDKKAPYFAHKKNCNCDYAKFDKEQKPEYDSLTNLLKKHFEKNGYIVSLEEKLIQGHYSPFVITLDSKQIAFEYTTPRITLKQIEKLEQAYHNKNITLQWIIVDTKTSPSSEKELCCIKRHLVNSSLYDNSFIQFNPTDNTLYQCKLNTVMGFNLFNTGNIPFENLFLNETKLSTKEFDEKYALWTEAHNLLPYTPNFNNFYQSKKTSVEIQKNNIQSDSFFSEQTILSVEKNNPLHLTRNEFASLLKQHNISRETGAELYQKFDSNSLTNEEIIKLRNGDYK